MSLGPLRNASQLGHIRCAEPGVAFALQHFDRAVDQFSLCRLRTLGLGAAGADRGSGNVHFVRHIE